MKMAFGLKPNDTKKPNEKNLYMPTNNNNNNTDTNPSNNLSAHHSAA